jgi:hypothetical protein
MKTAQKHFENNENQMKTDEKHYKKNEKLMKRPGARTSPRTAFFR